MFYGHMRQKHKHTRIVVQKNNLIHNVKYREGPVMMRKHGMMDNEIINANLTNLSRTYNWVMAGSSSRTMIYPKDMPKSTQKRLNDHRIKLLIWPCQISALNPFKNLWSGLKQKEDSLLVCWTSWKVAHSTQYQGPNNPDICKWSFVKNVFLAFQIVLKFLSYFPCDVKLKKFLKIQNFFPPQTHL